MADAELEQIARSRLGRVLREKYRLDRVLGTGGMATVYAATHRNKKRFAIKMLHPHLSIRAEIRTRFLREGYVANTVDHPGAVSVLDDDVAEDGSAFLVMELLEGHALDELAAKREGRRLPLGLVLSVGDALLDVLAAAHARKVVHRDLKPANLFLTDDGRLEVLDFGIARLHDETSAQATQTGAMLGTPAFMAPEQALAQSSKVDAQTDLWAVGATMFVLLTGRLVHEGENAAQLIVGAATKQARPLASVAPEVPGAVAEVIDKALAFEKTERWASAKEMREALAKACVEATGSPVAALPKTERVTGLEDTIAPDAGASSGSNAEALNETQTSPGSGGASGGALQPQTTAAGVSRSPPEPSTVGRRRVPWRLLTAVVLACAAIAGGVKAYQAVRAPRVRYCLDFEDTNDGPRCVFEVPADIVGKRRQVVSRFTERARRVVLVEHVNFAGIVADGDTDFARLEVVRDGSDAVEGIEKYDRFGVNLEWQRWSEGGRRIDYVDVDGKTPRHVVGQGRITTWCVEYDAQGRERRRLYFGPTGRPRADADGAYGMAFEYGRTPGLQTRQTNLGADGQPAPDASGIGFIHLADTGVPWADKSWFDVNEHPTTRRGAHTWHVHHNDYESTGGDAVGIHGEPVRHLEQSFHEVRTTWDPAKRTEDVVVLDEHEHPQPIRGMWVWALRKTYDDHGRHVLTEDLDSQGNRMVSAIGSAAHRHLYDDRNHETVQEELGPSGSLMRNNEAWARWETKRDDHDNLLEERAYDEKNQLASWTEGGAISRKTYDNRELLLSRADFDPLEHAVATVHGFSSEHWKYDRLRNRIELSFFAPDGAPTLVDDGRAVERSIYDDNDDLVAESFFDTTGAPTLFQSAYATRRLKNDERGLVVEESYLDVHGDPVLAKDGYASVKRTRDRNGDVTEEAYFGKRAEPVLREGAFAARKTSYDITRRPIEVALFDTTGQSVRGAAGWAIERTTYDERGLVTRTDHLDVKKKPGLDQDGRASVTKTWDSRGNLTEERSLDTSGKLIVASGGYATKKTTYDDRDEVIEEALLGADGLPVLGNAAWSLRRVRYDDFAKMTEESFFDGAHEPVVPKELVYSSLKQRFDEQHRLVEVAYFDTRGVPTKGPDGAAIVRFARDAFGRAVETRFFDGSGTPSPSKDGRVVIRSKFDDTGHLLDERFVDAAGAPRAASDGCSGHHTKYDALGHKLEESCLDAADSPTVSANGWAIRRTLHDAHGNDVQVVTYAVDGKTLLADKDGIARRERKFNERKWLVEMVYFGPSDKPAHDGGGAQMIRFTYDDSGKKTGESAFDERGQPLAKKERTSGR
jgi:serine/threonine protein kinase